MFELSRKRLSFKMLAVFAVQFLLLTIASLYTILSLYILCCVGVETTLTNV
jgi:hypothetical protein